MVNQLDFCFKDMVLHRLIILGKSYQKSMNQELKDSTKENLQERVKV